jgi:hypothetical protein
MVSSLWSCKGRRWCDYSAGNPFLSGWNVVRSNQAKGEFSMKNMQDFYEWLSAGAADSTPLQRRLALLTRLSREKVKSLAAFEPWFIWQAESADAV